MKPAPLSIVLVNAAPKDPQSTAKANLTGNIEVFPSWYPALWECKARRSQPPS